jgi:ribosomal protein S17E
LVNLINNSIDNFCAKVEVERGIENYRDTLTDTVNLAKRLVDELNTKARRIKEGEDILKGICLN